MCPPNHAHPRLKRRIREHAITSLDSCGQRVTVELYNALAENVLDGVFAAIVLADASSKLETLRKHFNLRLDLPNSPPPLKLTPSKMTT